MNVGAYRHLDDTTGAGWRHFQFFSDVFLNLKKETPVSLLVLNLAATLFTPETQKVFLGSVLNKFVCVFTADTFRMVTNEHNI